MNPPPRTSPLHDQLAKLNPRWTVYNNMQVPLTIGAREREEKALETVALTDLSCLRRCGLKGTNAASWLGTHGVSVPAGVNQWQPIGKCSLIARLATSEFLIEDGLSDESIADAIRQKLGRGEPGVTPVLRQDAEIALTGHAVNELLVQTSSVNFSTLNLDERPLVMTSMIGVFVMVIPGTWNGRPFYQVWCDHTFAPYLWRHLLEIAEELGGEAVGNGVMFKNFDLEV